MVSKIKSRCQNKCQYSGIRRLIIGVVLIIFSIASLLTDPVDMLTRFCVKISDHSFITYKMQQNLSSTEYSCYVFNITNPIEFMSGQDVHLKLEEIGPFTYHETRTNVDLEVNSENNTLKYTPSVTINFVRDKSYGYPNETIIFTPNTIFLALSSVLSEESYFLQNLFTMSLRPLQTKSILKMSVEDLLMGYDDPLVTIGRVVLPGIVMFKRFGLLSHVFGIENRVRYEVNTTDDNKFQIISVNGSRGIVSLGYNSEKKYCNSYVDVYEGMLFPTFMSPERNVRLYHKIICRMLDLQYVGNTTTDDGFEAYEYIINNDSYVYDGRRNECSCTSKQCVNGMSELRSCLAGLPVTMSNPHFLDADKSIFNKIEGLKPDREEHGNAFLIHKTIGVILKANLAIQLNVVMGDVRFNSEAKPFSNMVLPIAWGRAKMLPIPTDIKILLKIITNWFPKLVLISEILFVITGTYLTMNTLLQWYRARKEMLEREKILIPNINVEETKLALMVKEA